MVGIIHVHMHINILNCALFCFFFMFFIGQIHNFIELTFKILSTEKYLTKEKRKILVLQN